ncbi:MAG: 2-amino-4-hydroxy-6-hydroxymethyldihydropteridine diphosphokinase [Xanthomonadales bacterium]|nr:2-amino-4-hydroxy-6-hydroxymethyldihydropteridine diphosphokinase [Xanthomonadales bacterium]
MPAQQAVVGLGGNLAAPARTIAAALHRLAHWPGVAALRASRLYRSPPWGDPDQPDYVNAVACLDHEGGAHALLAGLLAIEREAGRRRGGARWGPRSLDLDLLVYGDQQIDRPGLQVPHPRLADRPFVLLPMAELLPDLALTGHGTVAARAAEVDAAGTAAIDWRARA